MILTMKKQKLIVIVGPTASGKSELAVRLARKFGGEIISADSRQIYQGLDIGSGKVPGKWLTWKRGFQVFGNGVSKCFFYKSVAHHCIDFVSPRRAFTAADFVRHARRAIAQIARRGRIPIIAGGTAFWIDALAYDFSLPAVKPNARLRRALEKKSPAQLLALLKKLDPARAAAIEQKNPRRIIRAIEIARALGIVPRLVRRRVFNILWIGLNPSYETRSHRIERRVHAMIREGLLAETKKLIRQGISKKRIRQFGFEYAAAYESLSGNATRQETIENITRDTKKYAKRQMTWWRRNKEIRWIARPDTRVAATTVKRFLTGFR